jgi:hypothetical protein
VSHDGRKTWQEWKPAPDQGAGPITEGTAVELRDGTLLVFNVHVEHIGGKVFETNFLVDAGFLPTLSGPRKFKFSMPEAETEGKDDRGEPISRPLFAPFPRSNSTTAICWPPSMAGFESDKAPLNILAR